MKSKYLKRLIGLAFLAMLTASTTDAEPLTFGNVVALQNAGSTRVDLFDNPGTLLYGSQISFLVDLNGDLPSSGIDTLQITFTEDGQTPVVQTFDIPVFAGITLPYSQIFSVSFLQATFQGTNATLRVDILGSFADFVIPQDPNAGQRVDSYTYHIVGVEPVPEPSSLVLLGIGLSSFSVKGFRKLKQRMRKN